MSIRLFVLTALLALLAPGFASADVLPPDAASGTDAATGTDAGSPDDSGGGCSTAPASSTPWWALGAAAGLLATRRR